MQRIALFLLGGLLFITPLWADRPALVELPVLPSLTLTSAESPENALPPARLVRADYEVDVYGAMASGTLIQQFRVTANDELEARYGVAVGPALRLDTLEVRIDGRIHDLPFAREQDVEPERAKRGRKPAGPVVFRGDGFVVEDVDDVALLMRFELALPLASGRFRLRLPLVLDARQGPQPVEVPVRVSITVHHDSPLLVAHSPSHEVLVDYAGDRSVIELVRQEGLEGRPFELELALRADDEPNLAGYVGEETDGRRPVTALLEPPVSPRDGTARPKQVLFVLDTSGSMGGQQKLDQARRALRACLAKLGPRDTFNIVEFDDRFSVFAEAPVAATAEQVRNGSAWIEGLPADRGTKLLAPLFAALTQPADAERHRMIVLVTDGVIHDEKETLALLEQELGEGRLFVVGIGPSMRQQTILRLVEFGRGGAAFAGTEQELESAVTEMFDAIAQPLAWDLVFDWGNAVVEEVQPARFPDLYAGRPVTVLAWVRGDMPAELRVRVTTMDGDHAYTVKLPPSR